jgi:hypothetical protein
MRRWQTGKPFEAAVARKASQIARQRAQCGVRARRERAGEFIAGQRHRQPLLPDQLGKARNLAQRRFGCGSLERFWGRILVIGGLIIQKPASLTQKHRERFGEGQSSGHTRFFGRKGMVWQHPDRDTVALLGSRSLRLLGL